MSEKKPFIIRNDTPHNVEVVAGSLNAKGKKSWVKANDEDHANNTAGEQHLDLDQHLENLLSSDPVDSDAAPVVTHAIQDNDSKLSKEGLSDRMQKIGTDEKGPQNLQGIPAPGASAAHLESVGTDSIKDQSQKLASDAIKDRSAQLQQSPSQKANEAKINQETLNENLQKISTSQVDENLQKVGIDKQADNLAKIGNEQAGKNVQTIDANKSIDNQVKLDQDKDSLNVQSLDQDQPTTNIAKLNIDKDSENLQTLAQDKSSDNQVKLDSDKGSVNVQNLKQDKTQDNKAKLPGSNATDRVQGLGVQGGGSGQDHASNETIDSNPQRIDEKPPEQNKQAIAVSREQDHSIALDNKGIENNTQTIAKDDASQNIAQIDGTVYDLKHQEKVYSEKIEDNVASIPAPSSIDNKVNIDSDKLNDQTAKLASTPVSDHVVGLPSDAPIEDNQVKIEAASIADRRAKFEEIRKQRNAPQLITPSDAVAPQGQKSQSVTSAKGTEVSKPLSREEQIALVRKKKSDEFHGRVEAIKNTVTQLNNQLDKLEDTSVELKKTRF